MAARDRAGVVGALGHEFRWNPARAAVGDAITSGAIGEPKLATVVEYSPFLLHSDDDLAMPSWFEEPGIGGWLGANGSHTLDQLRVWLGPFRSVSASMLVSAAAPDRTVEDSYSARFAMGDGVEVVLQNVGAAWTARGFVAVTGTLATVGIDDGRAWIADADGTRPLDGPAGHHAPTAEDASTTTSTRSGATRSATTRSSRPPSGPRSKAGRSTPPWRSRPSPTGWASCGPWTPCGPRPPPAGALTIVEGE